MDAQDIYRIRAEEFERNFESHRRVEWHVILEVFIGYAAIGSAYFHLHEKHGGSLLLGAGAILVTIILFSSSLYLLWRVQERMHYSRAMMNKYLEKLHEMCNAPMLPTPEGVKEPVHKKWWAFRTQLTISVTMMVLLIIYIAATTRWSCGG